MASFSRERRSEYLRLQAHSWSHLNDWECQAVVNTLTWLCDTERLQIGHIERRDRTLEYF